MKIKQDVKKPALSDDQFDQIIFTMCAFFNDYHFYEVSERLLEFINNTSTVRSGLERAKVLLFKNDYEGVIELTDEIVSNEKTHYHAWILRGNAYYFKHNLFDSAESYVKAVRFKPDRNERYDIKMLYRLGITYIKRKMWKFAQETFLQILKENNGFSFAWLYLGIAYMRMEEFSKAEEALNEANLLDVENHKVWAYLTIFCLSIGRKYQALESFNELNKANFEDYEILEEIADLFEKAGEYIITADIYNRIIINNPQNIDIYIKLSELYYYKFDTKKKESVDILKNCLEMAEDERDKKRISDFIELINNQLGVTENNSMMTENFDRNDDKDNNTEQTDIFAELNGSNQGGD